MTRFLLVAFLAAAVPSSADDRVEKLSDTHRSWLERDVVYIITDRERDVFLSLETEEERDRFIEAFWRKRDPNPATPTNEYKDEHYRRIDYANTFLGRETFREGWRTDRGRYYIILGEPREIQRYEGYAQVVSSHVWFYQGDPTLGLPSFFYLLFFKKHDFGEFQLYNPIIDGPQALLTGSQFTPGSDNRAAVEALREVSSELAAASLSFDTSEPPDFIGGRPAMGTAIMIARIEDSPKRAIRTDYAEAWMRYGNRVSAEYSFNYVPSRSCFVMLFDPGGTALVHYSVEIDPQNFSLETDEDASKYYTTLDVTVEVRTKDGTLVLANDREVYLEITPAQMLQVRASPFAYQDDLPLVPGEFSISVIVRNRVLKQYTVAEREIRVPETTGAPLLADIIVAFASETIASDAAEDEIRTFQLGDLRVQPAADNLFVIGDTIHLVTQAFGASVEDKVIFELANGEEVLRTLSSPVGTGGVVLDHLRLDDLVGGNYDIRARLVSPDGEELAKKSVEVTVSPRSVAPRPAFISRRGFNTRSPGLLALVRGEQFWNMGLFREAKAELESAVASGNPRLPAARWKLANAYLREERPDDALKLLEPLEQDFPRQFEVVAGLGYVHYFKQNLETAADYLSRAREIRPPDTTLLNALADCYQRLGDLEKAKETFERSLALEPDQPAVKDRLGALGKP